MKSIKKGKNIDSTFKCCGKNAFQDKFYKFSCQISNFISLSQLNVTYHKENKIVREFVSAKGCDTFICYCEKYHLVYQYVYSVFYSRIYHPKLKECC